MINKRLFYHKSTLIKGDLAITIAASGSSGSLPDGFWAFMERPYMDGKTYALRPVPNIETKLKYDQDSIPIYYERVGTTLNLYPGWSAGGTIKGLYWTTPTALTKHSDTIPYNGLYDDILQEALIHIYATGDSTNQGSIMTLTNFINESIDQIEPYTAGQAPKRFDDNYGLDYMANTGDFWYE